MTESLVMQEKFNQLLKSLLSSVNSLAKIITKENQALEDGVISVTIASSTKKQQLLAGLHDMQQQVSEYLAQGLAACSSAEVTEQINRGFTCLERAMQKNELLLQINIAVSNKMIEIYKEQCSDKAINQFGYNKDGAISGLKTLEKIMPSTSLNNKV